MESPLHGTIWVIMDPSGLVRRSRVSVRVGGCGMGLRIALGPSPHVVHVKWSGFVDTAPSTHLGVFRARSSTMDATNPGLAPLIDHDDIAGFYPTILTFDIRQSSAPTKSKIAERRRGGVKSRKRLLRERLQAVPSSGSRRKR